MGAQKPKSCQDKKQAACISSLLTGLLHRILSYVFCISLQKVVFQSEFDLHLNPSLIEAMLGIFHLNCFLLE